MLENDTSGQTLLQRRENAMGPTYRLFYREPVHLVKGAGVWLFDAAGKKYLDCYNNVASVGHCHPYVVAALSKQAATLNTHTRYLHENVVNYAERLSATLPGELSVCMFVCTGTEANDLAFRIARTVSGNMGAIVSDYSYHGNSIVVTELSTAEYPESEQPDWLATAESPNGFRGSFRYGEPGLGPKYASKVDDAVAKLQSRGHDTAMFMTCNIFDSNGALVAPEGYLRDSYAKVRAAGGLCVADEVQSGLCRLGDRVWGFEDSDVIPDIVTMGKPIGDGHPVAAVVTTPAIAQAFSKKFHYFNTFGGNPVSAAVGLAVLDVIEQENILQNVHDTGQYLAENLRSLARQYGCIGDVRGKGLFYGLEIVREAGSLEADHERASRIAEGMREAGVLLSTTGPYDNVVKIRPPMVFSKANADVLVNALGEVMAKL
ncbi:MAG: aminotransferase class III-fold pyridoxal phosphate-dependent enzyme [Xanthomonadales bacterium]|nr:aminotransferase class III-fold pyridoxal phosphate-dependent enzyme [Xanthomonadales bacterium]